MKRFPNLWPARAGAAVFGLLVLGGTVRAQQQPVVSASPEQRRPRSLPPPAEGGIRLSLQETVGLAVANNQDLTVSVNTAEASRFSLFQTTGIFDPLLL